MGTAHDDMNSTEKRPNDSTDRPEFAVALGLLPPYALDDVKRAYLAKVKTVLREREGRA